METISNFKPLHPLHPFRLLKQEMQARGIKGKDMAQMLNMQPSNFSRLLHSQNEITPSLANKLEEILGIPATLWLSLQSQYLKETRHIKPETTTKVSRGRVGADSLRRPTL